MSKPEENQQGAPGWGFGYGPTAPPYGAPWGAPPGYGWAPPHPPPGYYTPSGPEGQPKVGGAPAGFAAAMGDIADKSGLGMFKDLFNWDDGEFWKGAIVGAAVVVLMTNEDLRNSLIGGAAKTAEAVKSGLAGFAADQAEGEDVTSKGEASQDRAEETEE